MFLNRLNISTKITALLTFLVVVAVLTVSYVSYQNSKDSIMERNWLLLNDVADVRVQKVNRYFEMIDRDIDYVAQIPVVSQQINSLDEALASSTQGAESQLYLDIRFQLDEYLGPMVEKTDFRRFYLLNSDQKVIYTTAYDTNATQPGAYMPDFDGNVFIHAKNSTYFSVPFKEGNHRKMVVAAPIKNASDEFIGYIWGELYDDEIQTILNDKTGLGKSGEVIIVKKYENNVVFLNNVKKEGHDLHSIVMGTKKNQLLQSAANEKQIRGAQDVDYAGEQVYGVTRYIPSADWGLVVKKDKGDVLAPIRSLLTRYLISGLIIILASLVLVLIASRRMTHHLKRLQSALALLSKGALPNHLNYQGKDEIGSMVQALNTLRDGLRDTAEFAKRIGQEDLDARFEPLSKEDNLGQALLDMRSSLKEAERKDEERNWIVRGVAEIGDVLRRNNEIEAVGDEILSYITEKIEATQAALYVKENEDNEEGEVVGTHLEMKSSFAYNKKKYLHSRFKIGDGFVGQAAIEQDTILRTEIPEDYVTITSGILGDKRPDCLLFVPLIANQEVYGVLEFASTKLFTNVQVQFVQEVSQIIARTILDITVNERIRKLLADSQKQNEELQYQEQELRNNAEEMAATQEELKRSNAELESKVEEVNNTQKRMQSLLENASEVISIYEEDGTIRYISPSVKYILGYEPEEMVNVKDITKVHPEGKKDFEEMFEQLLKNPDEEHTTEYSYLLKSGDYIWLEANGRNLLDDPAIQGIVLNIRDITERRRAEKESRMRGQMQSLSENSPDLITRLNAEGTFFYVNPIIKDYTGYGVDHFMNQNIYDLKIDNQSTIKEGWVKIFEKLQEEPQKMQEEMEIMSTMGERILQVSAIPEFTENDKLESVLLVSHDITEAKLIQMEIQSKNKKISESINYAKRIQNAILPDNKVVRRVFPESFTLFMPKDVVSGDFPWFMEKGDYVYISAVDCTGHGVPGALMSLVGYFILNDIVRNHDYDAGEVLDRMNDMVTQTLRQNEEDSKTKDGMDIAFLRYSRKDRVLDYAGAHRSLYYLPAEGEQQEFKGNKFPIGGGSHYKKRTNFTNYSIEIGPGDMVYFCSDGYPDQFGGPGERPRKIGPKRVRQFVADSKGKNMREVEEYFDTQFHEWKGEEKQLDDVLMMGIKF